MSQEKDSAAQPRLLTRAQAAAYCNISLATFSRWTSEGLLPQAIPKTKRWDRRAIDRALDRISGIEELQTNALDRWKEQRNARQT